jgi:short-subunit dehydrogenase
MGVEASHSIRRMTERVALITGASSGLGEAAARRLAQEPGMRIVLLARRAERLEALAAELPAPATALALDLLDDDAPERARAHLQDEYGGQLHLLVNNAGTGGRGAFADTGYEAIRRTMRLNFDAQVRLTEALLPLLRASAPSAIVNIASTAARVGRPGAGAYSASKAALAVWSDALRAEEHAHGVHVGTVMPGFIPTEGFPQRELTEKRTTRWMLGTPEQAAEAIVQAGLDRRAERYVPRFYGGLAALRTVAPGLLRRALRSKRADMLATSTREPT